VHQCPKELPEAEKCGTNDGWGQGSQCVHATAGTTDHAKAGGTASATRAAPTVGRGDRPCLAPTTTSVQKSGDFPIYTHQLSHVAMLAILLIIIPAWTLAIAMQALA